MPRQTFGRGHISEGSSPTGKHFGSTPGSPPRHSSFLASRESRLRLLKGALQQVVLLEGCARLDRAHQRNVEHVKKEGDEAFEVSLFDVSLSLFLSHIINGTSFSLSDKGELPPSHTLQPQALMLTTFPFLPGPHASKANLVGEGGKREKEGRLSGFGIASFLQR